MTKSTKTSTKSKKKSTKRKQVTKQKYHGIVDCHGVESLMPYKSENVTLYFIRAMANRQRHAVYYECMLSKTAHDGIMAQCRQGDYASALTTLRIATPLDVPKDQAKSLNLIPNPDLDPWC